MVLALADHVLLLDGTEHIAQIERHAVVKEVGGIAHTHVIAVVVVAVDDALGIGSTERQVSLVLVAAGAQAHRVGYVGARLEEVGRTVIAGRRQFLTPTEVTARLTRTVLVLETGQHKGPRELETAVVGHIYPTRTAALGRDEDDTISGVSTVQCGRRGTRQGADALDVVGVDVAGCITRLARTGKNALRLLAREVLHGDAVHDIQHVVVAVDRLGTTHHNAAAAARTRCAGIDGHTGHLSGQRVDEVGVLHPHQRIAFNLLHIVGQRLGLLLDTQGGYHHLVKDLGILLEVNGQSLAVNLHFLSSITHIAHSEASTLVGSYAESTVKVGDGIHIRALDTHGRPDDRVAVLVKHLPSHRRGLHRAALPLRHRSGQRSAATQNERRHR